MSLYVRVLNNFYTHRKTLRLRAMIGNDAFWVPPRLWAYASENQPDGCFKDYAASEIAMLIGYVGDAQVMLEALLQAGFIDKETMQVHDWQEHNAYHSVFSARAKKAAEARWAKPPPAPPLTVPDLKGKEPSIASSMKPIVKSSEKPSETTEHVAFIDGWVQNFKAQFGLEYQFDSGRDGKAVKELLRMQILRIDLLEIAKKAWRRASQAPKSFNCEQASTIHGFRHYLNQIQVELKNGNTPHQQNNKRLDGVSRNNAVNNYGEAAQRKMERDALASKDRPPPIPSGT